MFCSNVMLSTLSDFITTITLKYLALLHKKAVPYTIESHVLTKHEPVYKQDNSHAVITDLIP